MVYNRLVVSWIANLHQPEQAAEVVDFMVRFDQVDWALCGGVCNGRLVLSLRTCLHGVKAGDLLRTVVNGLGKAGGHDRRAGGCIEFNTVPTRDVESIQDELLANLLKALNWENAVAEPLVVSREAMMPI